MRLSNQLKVLSVFFCFSLAVVGFLVKLPAQFSHHDKILHTLFYFAAAAFLNILFAKASLIRHAIIFAALYSFSVGIEYAQEYSNKFFHKRIHGRYDPEDIEANLKGLILFSILWLIVIGIQFAYRSLQVQKVKDSN